jgi:hypothetical protein
MRSPGAIGSAMNASRPSSKRVLTPSLRSTANDPDLSIISRRCRMTGVAGVWPRNSALSSSSAGCIVSSCTWRGMTSPVSDKYLTLVSVGAFLRSLLPTSSTKRRQSMGKSTRFAIERNDDLALLTRRVKKPRISVSPRQRTSWALMPLRTPLTPWKTLRSKDPTISLGSVRVERLFGH